VESEVEFVIQSRDGVDLRLGFRQSTLVRNVSGTNARNSFCSPQTCAKHPPVVSAAELCSRAATVVAGHTMAQPQQKAKLNYKPGSSIEVFYSGGAVSLSINRHVACACQDDIKVIPGWWYLRWHEALPTNLRH